MDNEFYDFITFFLLLLGFEFKYPKHFQKALITKITKNYLKQMF